MFVFCEYFFLNGCWTNDRKSRISVICFFLKKRILRPGIQSFNSVVFALVSKSQDSGWGGSCLKSSHPWFIYYSPFVFILDPISITASNHEATLDLLSFWTDVQCGVKRFGFPPISLNFLAEWLGEWGDVRGLWNVWSGFRISPSRNLDLCSFHTE